MSEPNKLKPIIISLAEEMLETQRKMSEENKLKPCPRCGGECLPQSVYFTALHKYRTLVYCDKCGLQSGYFDTEQEATDWWNDRKAEREHAEVCEMHRHVWKD